MSPAPLIPTAETVRAPRATQAQWRIVALAGSILCIVGLADIALVFVPWRLGAPGWEFGVITGALSSLPLVVVGFTGWLGAAVALGRTRMARMLGVCAILFGLLILVGFVLYLTGVPVALRTAPEQVLIGIKKSIVRTSLMALVFGTCFIVSGITALRAHTDRPK